MNFKYVFENNENSPKYTFKNGGGSNIKKIMPSISSNEFSFVFETNFPGNIHGNRTFNIGVVSSEHKNSTYFVGGIGNEGGWGLWVGYGYKTAPNSQNQSQLGKEYVSGDRIGFRVSRLEKKIWYVVNGEEKGVLHSNCSFPAELHIAASAYGANGTEHVELVEVFGDRGIHSVMSSEGVEDIEGRMDFLLDHTNVQIPLQNKTLGLWKVFLNQSSSSSSNNLWEGSEYTGLKDLSLDVDESVILRFHMGLNSGISKPHDFLDYFKFFQRIGGGGKVHRELIQVLDELRKTLKDFKSCFQIFTLVVNEFESDESEVKSWFSLNPQIIDSGNIQFDSSLTLSVFNYMKLFEKEVTLQSSLMILPYVGVVIYHLRKFEVVRDIVSNHSDFSSISDPEELKISTFFTKLFNSARKTSNLELKTCDGKLFHVHREILLFRSSFFYKMLSFGGRESEEMKNSSSVQLEDLSSSEMSILLRFFYSVPISPKKVELVSLIKCLIHCDKYFESQASSYFMKLLSDLISERRSQITEGYIKSKLRKVSGILLAENLKEDIIETICFSSGGKLKRARIQKFLTQSEKDSFRMSMKRENNEMKKRIITLEDRVKNLEQIVMMKISNVGKTTKKKKEVIKNKKK